MCQPLYYVPTVSHSFLSPQDVGFLCDWQSRALTTTYTPPATCLDVTTVVLLSVLMVLIITGVFRIAMCAEMITAIRQPLERLMEPLRTGTSTVYSCGIYCPNGWYTATVQDTGFAGLATTLGSGTTGAMRYPRLAFYHSALHRFHSNLFAYSDWFVGGGTQRSPHVCTKLLPPMLQYLMSGCSKDFPLSFQLNDALPHLTLEME